LPNPTEDGLEKKYLCDLRASAVNKNRNPKGWSMKQSAKTPFFEKGDGVFVLRWMIKGSRIIELNQKQSDNREKNKLF